MYNKVNISVALCTYNGAKYLRPQLDSILNQSLPADEIIIIDDNSTDDTFDILKEYSLKYKSIQLFKNEKNLGFLRNFSLAISKTIGNYIALADQDDIWSENHIESLLANIGEKAICVGEAELIDSNGNKMGLTFNQLKGNNCIPEEDIPKAYKIIYNYNPYRGADMLIDREWLNPFLPIPNGVDYHDTFLAACASLTSGINVIHDVVSYYRIHGEQVSKNVLKVTLFDELKRRRHHICFYNKHQIIKTIADKTKSIHPAAQAFIDEFNYIQELDKMGRRKRIQILKILNSHYKHIYSCSSFKYIFPRSLHFLLSP